MSAATIRLADSHLSEALKRFSESAGTAGAISLKLEREEEFLDSFAAEGERTDIFAAIAGDEIVGSATYSERRCYSGNSFAPVTVGLVGNVRIAAEHRSTTIFGKGAKVLRDRCAEKHILTLVQEDNIEVIDLIRGRRPLLPRFVDEGRICTLLIEPRRALRKLKGSSCEIRIGTDADIPELVELFRRHGSKRRYFPALQESDFAMNRLPGMNISDFCLAFSSGRLVGALAVWNQLKFRRWIVNSYDKRTGRLRLVYNAFTRLAGGIPLPPPGMKLPSIFLSFPCVIDDDPRIFIDLIRAACRSKLNADHFFVIGLHERDPFLECLLPIAGRVLNSRLFSGSWRGNDGMANGSVPYLDLATV